MIRRFFHRVAKADLRWYDNFFILLFGIPVMFLFMGAVIFAFYLINALLQAAGVPPGTEGTVAFWLVLLSVFGYLTGLITSMVIGGNVSVR